MEKISIMQHEAKDNIIIPVFIFEHHNLSMEAKMVYALLIHYSDEGKDHCTITDTRLAARLFCSEDAVTNYIDELVKNQLIQVKKTNGVKGNTYYFLQPKDCIQQVANR